MFSSAADYRCSQRAVCKGLGEGDGKGKLNAYLLVIFIYFVLSVFIFSSIGVWTEASEESMDEGQVLLENHKGMLCSPMRWAVSGRMSCPTDSCFSPLCEVGCHCFSAVKDF